MYTIFRGGCNSRHPLPFLMSKPQGIFCHILLIIKSPALFKIGEQTLTVRANSALIIHPNIPYTYQDMGEEYINDWIYFESDDPAFENCDSRLFHHPIFLGDVSLYSQYIHHILWENSYSSEPFRTQNMDMLMQVLINNLLQAIRRDEQPDHHNPYASRLQSLRLTMQTQAYKNFTPDQLADSLGVSPSHFQYLYKEFFGVPFKTDLINFRIDYAKDLILNTDLKMEQIALMSGYSNEIHFYRQFKAKTGMTPREYLMTTKR